MSPTYYEYIIMIKDINVTSQGHNNNKQSKTENRVTLQGDFSKQLYFPELAFKHCIDNKPIKNI